MKRAILFSSLGLVALVVFLLTSGLLSVGISPYHYYKLNETETKLIDEGILKFREKVEAGKFDEIQNELADGRRSKSE